MPLIYHHRIRPHKECPDGLAAAWVVNKYLIESNQTHNKFVGVSYPHHFELPNKAHEQVYVVDYKINATVLASWLAAGHHITVIDHHQGMIDEMQQLSHPNLTKVLDNNSCAAKLAWEYFFPSQPLPAFIAYINDRDLMQNKLPHSNEIHAAYSSLKRTFDTYTYCYELGEEFVATLSKLGKKHNNCYHRSVNSVAARHQLANIAGYQDIPCLTLNKKETAMTNDIAKRLYTSYPNAPFVALKSAKANWSLRAAPTSEVNLLELCSKWEPQGHRSAAHIKTNDPFFYQCQTTLQPS